MTDSPENAKDTVKPWLSALEKEKKAHKEWRDCAQEVEDYFSGDKKTDLNILWSNTQILHSALYSATPNPEVRRRYADAQEARKDLAVMMERALTFMIDQQEWDAHMDQAVMGYLVAGMGQVRVRYEADVEDVGLDEMGRPVEVITNQFVRLEAVRWQDFHWEPGKDWEGVDWVCFDHYLTKKKVRKEFGVVVDQTEQSDEQYRKKEPDKVLVHEIWHKPSRRVIYVSPQHPDGVLDVHKDALGLEGFYPCPRPMLANPRAGRLVPWPEFKYYEPQARQLDVLAKRISKIVKTIKNAGFYDGQLVELGSLSDADDGDLVPISDLMERLSSTSSANFDNVVAMLPIEHAQRVVASLRDDLDKTKDQIYEMTGISDIVRGATAASETATAQQIKGQWAGVRLSRKQNEVNRFIRSLFRITAEIIGEHFTPEVLSKVVGMQLDANAVMALQTDLTRNILIDVETDSTIAKDEMEERGQRLEMLSTVTNYLSSILPLVQQGTMPVDLAKQLLLTTVRSFKHGRSLEETIESAPDAAGQQAQTMQQLQQVQEQAQQQMEELQQVIEERNSQIQDLSSKVEEFDAREAQREDIVAQSEVLLNKARAEKDAASAEKMRLEARKSLTPVM